MAKKTPKKPKGKKQNPDLTTTDKIDLFEKLMVFYEALQQAESARRRMGYPEEADLIAHWSDKLNRVMDNLRGHILASWMTDAKALVEQILDGTADVEASIAELKKDARMADRVVSVISQAEKVITKLAALMPAPV